LRNKIHKKIQQHYISKRKEEIGERREKGVEKKSKQKETTKRSFKNCDSEVAKEINRTW